MLTPSLIGLAVVMVIQLGLTSAIPSQIAFGASVTYHRLEIAWAWFLMNLAAGYPLSWMVAGSLDDYLPDITWFWVIVNVTRVIVVIMTLAVLTLTFEYIKAERRRSGR